MSPAEKSPPSNRVVLAYSGGLDTSVILKILSQQGYEVLAFIADVGQREDFDVVADRARKTGAAEIFIENLQEPLIRDFVYPALASNAVYESRYLLGTSLARPIIARRQVELALEHGASAVAHGATGKGNDQVRFELAYAALAPELKVIAPWKDHNFLARFKGRRDLLRFADEEQIPVDVTLKKPYSIDENLLHTSHEAGSLENPARCPDEEMYERTVSPERAPDRSFPLELRFESARLVEVVDRDQSRSISGVLPIFTFLNEIGERCGIGRIDIVENRFLGIKSRGVYETPGGTIIHHALRDLEGLTMDREVVHLRDQWAPKYAELIYNGFWFSPEADFLRAAFTQSQQRVYGRVRLRLYKGNIIIEGRDSALSLYNEDLSSMDIEGGYDQSDAAGFIAVNGLRLSASRAAVAKQDAPSR